MGLLALDGLHLSFGGVTALDGVSLDVHDGEIVAIIGPNGAGKTSLLNCISGPLPAQRGSIVFDGRGHHRRWPHQRASSASRARSRTSSCSPT